MTIYGVSKFGSVLEQNSYVYGGVKYNDTTREYGTAKAIQSRVEYPSGKVVLRELTPDYCAQITRDANSIYSTVIDNKTDKFVVDDFYFSQKPKNKLQSILGLLTGTATKEDIPFSYSSRFRSNPDGSTSKFTISNFGTRTLVKTDANNNVTKASRTAPMNALRKLGRKLKNLV